MSGLTQIEVLEMWRAEQEGKYATASVLLEKALQKDPAAAMVALATILSRDGWTRSLVDRFLGAPDAMKENPHYKQAAPMRLYGWLRVVEAERTPEFVAAVEVSTRRRISAKSVAMKREAELLQKVRTMPIAVPDLPLDKMRRAAIESYNERALDMESDRWADGSSDRTFLNRITVNYIRHERTEYDSTIAEELRPRPGVDEAVQILHDRINQLIRLRYPALFKNTCSGSTAGLKDKDDPDGDGGKN